MYFTLTKKEICKFCGADLEINEIAWKENQDYYCSQIEKEDYFQLSKLVNSLKTNKLQLN